MFPLLRFILRFFLGKINEMYSVMVISQGDHHNEWLIASKASVYKGPLEVI